MLAHPRCIFCLLLLLAGAHAALSQSAPQASGRASGTAAITGVVKLGDAPASGITIALAPERMGRMAQQPQPEQEITIRAVTDEKGQYRFTNVAVGRFRVAPLAEAFVVENNGARAGGVAVTVTEGQTVSNIDFTLARGGVITGRVTDGDGRPVIAERINLAMAAENGRAQPFNGGNRISYETDDRGVYRIYGLPAGRYIVSAGGGDRPGVSRRIRYPRTFYPDAVEQAQAQIVGIEAGGEAENIDIHLGAPMKAYAVAGRVVDAENGQPVFGVPVNIGRERRGGPAGATSGTSNAEGEFRVTGLTSGRYSASVRSSGFPGGGAENATDFYSDPVSFEVNDDNVTGVEVKVHRGASITGVVVIEGASDPSVAARLSQLTISANSRGGQTQRQAQNQGQAGRGGMGGRQNFAQVGPNGAFRIGGIAPGRVRLNVGGFGGGGGFSLARIERGGAVINGDFDVASGEQVTGIRVVVGYGTGVIQGRVVVTGGALPPGTRLIVSVRSLISAGQNRPAQVDASGQFRVEGLLPGSYEVRLNALAGGGGFGGGRGGGRGGAPNRPQIKIPDVRQTVNVVNGSPSGVTLNLDLSQQ
ncbi:MAG: carboxypeptidase regulatory-like domain-containing protein [Blastocatellales bacterium]